MGQQLTVNLANLIVAAGLPRPEQEYPFQGLSGSRRWRWDLAWPDRMLAVERQGSTWTGGRHTRGAGYRNDAIKSAEGQILGWIVIHVTTDMLKDGTAFTLVERALQVRGWKRSGDVLQ